MKTSLQSLQEKIGEWSDEKGSTLKGLLNHLIEEAKDLQENPYDSLAYADIAILWLAAARQAGFTVDDLIQAIDAKHQINVAREWLPADEEGVIRHSKSKQ